MSISMPRDSIIEIFINLPLKEMVTTCRGVCKEWNSISYELSLWQKVAARALLDIKPGFTAQQIESRLKRLIVISSDLQLKQKFQSFFFNIPEGETRAVHYLSASKPTDAYGFFVKNKNNAISSQITGPECNNVEGLKDFVEKMQGLTIIGKDEADLPEIYRFAKSYAYPEQMVDMVNVQDKLHTYFSI